MNHKVNGAFVVPAGHPALEGHFPGRPVVPGVLLLDLTHAAIPGSEAWVLQSIPVAKFLQPVLPGERIEVEIELESGATPLRARFRARREGVPVYEGSFVFSTEATA